MDWEKIGKAISGLGVIVLLACWVTLIINLLASAGWPRLLAVALIGFSLMLGGAVLAASAERG